MVPHSLFVSSDRHVDLTLRLLTLVVVGGLLASAAWTVFTWLRPATAADRGDVGPPAWAAVSETLLNPPHLELPGRVELPTRIDLEVPLPYGAMIYRCEHRGRVTYSDQPCMVGRVRAVTVRPS
jgi:hypothetical protein